MSLSLFQTHRGIEQGRIRPTAAPAANGSYAFVLGSDTFRFAEMEPGDYAQILGSVDVTSIDVITADVSLIVRDVPAGLKWTVKMLIGIDEFASITGWANSTRRPDLSAAVRHLTGNQTVYINLTLEAIP